MLKRASLFPIGMAVFVAFATIVSSSYLRSIDTSFSGYLSGLMLNFWGGERSQLIRVNLYNHSIALYADGVAYTVTRIAATGNPSDRTATPIGRYRILSKDKRHISGLSGVIMPYSLRFFEGYYFHDIPLTPAGKIIDTKYSHGCIRLSTSFAQELFAWTKVGAYVEIYSSKLARADGSDAVYLLTEDGQRKLIPTEAAFVEHGFQWRDVAVVPPSELDALPLGVALQ